MCTAYTKVSFGGGLALESWDFSRLHEVRYCELNTQGFLVFVFA